MSRASLSVWSLCLGVGLFWGVFGTSGCGNGPPSQELPKEQALQEPGTEQTTPEQPPPEPRSEPVKEPPVADAAEPTPDVAPDATPETRPEPAPEPTPEPSPEQPSACTPLPNIQQTWDWAKTTGKPLSTGFLVKQNDKVVFEAYEPGNATRLIPSGGGAGEIYNMYSQTKTLTGLTALLLVKQGKLKLDDKVSQYISEWKSDADKKEITIRALLTLSSGIQTSVNSPTDQNATRAIQSPFVGKKFAYGTEPFLVFSVLVERLTTMSNEAFLQKHLFGPLGAKISIKKTVDGFSSMAQGGQTTLRDMIKIGDELLLAARGQGAIFRPEDLKTLMTPGVNAAYGLSVWLNQDGQTPGGGTFSAPWPACGSAGLLSFLGAGGQVLTIVPAMRLVFSKSARLGSVSEQNSEGLWSRLFQEASCVCQAP